MQCDRKNKVFHNQDSVSDEIEVICSPGRSFILYLANEYIYFFFWGSGQTLFSECLEIRIRFTESLFQSAPEL